MKQPSQKENSLNKMTSTPGSVQSVSRALDLLEAFLQYGPEIGLTNIANLLHLNKTTAYRLLLTLKSRGYIEHSLDSRKYQLGLRAFELGAYYQNQLKVRKLGLTYLHEIVNETHEGAFLCIREGDYAVCIDRVEADTQVVVFALRVGGRQPLHHGAAPRALFMGMDEEELAAYAARTGLPQATPYTIKTLEELIGDVRNTRQQGFTISINDVTVGIAAVGAPVYDHQGHVVASISLSGLSNHFESERLSSYTKFILDTSSRFSRQLGNNSDRITP